MFMVYVFSKGPVKLTCAKVFIMFNTGGIQVCFSTQKKNVITNKSRSWSSFLWIISSKPRRFLEWSRWRRSNSNPEIEADSVDGLDRDCSQNQHSLWLTFVLEWRPEWPPRGRWWRWWRFGPRPGMVHQPRAFRGPNSRSLYKLTKIMMRDFG